MKEAAQNFEVLRAEVGELFELANTFENLFHEEANYAGHNNELTARIIMERTAPRFFAQVNDVFHRLRRSG